MADLALSCVTKKNQVKIAEDIAAANREGLEVRVSYGEKVGSHA